MTMKVLNVKLLENTIVRNEIGIKLRHKENNSEFSNLAIDVLTREYYISNTKKLQAHIEKVGGVDKVNFDDLQIVPLYRKCLVDVNDNNKGFETVIIRIETTISDIASLEVEGIYALQPIITNGKIEGNETKIVAFAATVQKGKEDSFQIKIHRMDKKLFTIHSESIWTCEAVNYTVKKVKRLNCKRLVSIPKKSFITNDMNEKREGYISVMITDIMSKNTVIREKTKNLDYIFSDKLSDDQLKAAKNLLKFLQLKK